MLRLALMKAIFPIGFVWRNVRDRDHSSKAVCSMMVSDHENAVEWFT